MYPFLWKFIRCVLFFFIFAFATQEIKEKELDTLILFTRYQGFVWYHKIYSSNLFALFHLLHITICQMVAFSFSFIPILVYWDFRNVFHTKSDKKRLIPTFFFFWPLIGNGLFQEFTEIEFKDKKMWNRIRAWKIL